MADLSADIEQVTNWAASKKLSVDTVNKNALCLWMQVNGCFGDAYTIGHLEGKNPYGPNECWRGGR